MTVPDSIGNVSILNKKQAKYVCFLVPRTVGAAAHNQLC